MNYTPNDIQNMAFKKAVMGYNEDQVNEVLDGIIEDYNAYIRENLELKDKVAVLNDGLQHYKTIEDSLQNALLVAQKTGEEIKKNSYDKAENIIKDAEINAQKMINDASHQIMKIKIEHEELRKRLHVFKSKTEALLLSQLEILKQVFEDNDEL